MTQVAIIGGGLPGCELGHLCMETGRRATIIEEKKKIGYDVGGSDRFGLINGFKKAENIEMHALTKVTEITDKGVKAVRTDKEGNQTEIFVPANLVGDADEPHRIADATKAGYVAACAI